MQTTELLICPVCSTALTQQEKILICANAHSFDLAKEGYINFLLKKQPGDTKEMLVARRSFFEQDFYRPLSDALNQLIARHLSPTIKQPVILDAGCGEGYYLARLHTYLVEHQFEPRTFGLDISKEAIRMAAKRYKEAFFIVANLKEKLPIADQALHVLLNIFAPRNTEQYARILAPQGLFLIVIPGPKHLYQLRADLHLLNIEENKQQNVLDQFADQFELITTQSIAYPIQLNATEINQVVMMTPNYWHLSDATRKAMAELIEIATEVDFTCLLLRRHP